MELLFKREQSNAASGGVNFKLWSKIELDEDEKALVSKYRFDQALLIFAYQPGLIRNSIVFGLLGIIPGALLVSLLNFSGLLGAVVLIGCVAGVAYWSYARKLVTALSGGGLKLFDAVDECNALNDLGHAV